MDIPVHTCLHFICYSHNCFLKYFFAQVEQIKKLLEQYNSEEKTSK